MTPNEYASSLRYRFTWESDGKLDSWQCLPLSGPVRGDCDDYATTLARSIAGSWFRFWIWVLTFKIIFYWCRSPNGGLHIVLWLRGHGNCDNWRTEFSPVEDIHSPPFRWLPFRVPIIAPIVFIKLLIGKFDKT